MSRTFLFATGIENSCPTIGHGSIRRDQMRECGHYQRWREDFALVRQLGIGYLRYGVPLYASWPGPDRYDWTFADQAFAELRRLDIGPIADLCHFGVPDWLGDFQNPDFPVQFARYAAAFAQRYPWVQLYTPVNEMYACALYSALLGYWNEQQRSERAFVNALRHLVLANLLAMRAILDVRPDAIFVQSESSQYFHPDGPDAMAQAERLNGRRFLALDLNYGRRVDSEMYEYLMDHGMSRAEYHGFAQLSVKNHCIMGTDYYGANEFEVDAQGAVRSAAERYGYALIAREYYDRYRLPMLFSETNLDQGRRGTEAVDWLHRQWAQVLALARDGVPVVGFTWYPLTDQVDWDIALRAQRGRVNPRGLADQQRRIRPVGDAYRTLIAKWKDVLPLQSHSLRVAVAGNEPT